MDENEFEQLVAEAILALPDWVRQKMDNVGIVVEDFPSPEQLKKGQTGQGSLLLGLYEGVPKSRRGSGYTLALPDKITIFKSSIESVTSSVEEVKARVRETVWHEIAHHFGFSEEAVRKLARKRKGT